MPHSEITEAVLVHCNVVHKDYQQDSGVLYTIISNELFGQLLDISPQNIIFLKTFDSEILYIEVRCIDRNSNPLETEDKISITLVIN